MKFYYPEAATPIEDLSDLKLNWIQTQKELNQVESENILAAMRKYLLKAVGPPDKWFNVVTLNKIHHAMFCDVWTWAGKFRTTQTSIGIKPYQIVEALENLCQDVKYWNISESNLDLIEQAAQIHHRLVLIHPYSNGNGRFSRLIADRYLKAWKSPFPSWPIDITKDGKCRKNYITALKKADEGDYTALISFMKQYGAKSTTFS